jgi:hypothetical protein
MTVLLTRRPRACRPSGIPADRQRHARWMAYLGCAGAVGYGGMKVAWALGGTVGLSNAARYHATENGLSTAGRFFDQWGTPILAGLAIVILLGLIYPSGNGPILRPLLRALAWAGSLIAMWGLVGLILTILYIVGDHIMGVGDLDAGTYVFTYICFVMLGLGFGGTAWLTRRQPSSSAPAARSPATSASPARCPAPASPRAAKLSISTGDARHARPPVGSRREPTCRRPLRHPSAR